MGTQRQRHQTYTQTQTERRHRPKSKKDRNTSSPPKLALGINAERGFGGKGAGTGLNSRRVTLFFRQYKQIIFTIFPRTAGDTTAQYETMRDTVKPLILLHYLS